MTWTNSDEMARSIWIGYDPREADGFAVCRNSIQRHLTQPIPVRGIILNSLRKQGMYDRPTEKRDGQLYDVISDAPMSTEFAISRFYTPILAKRGWALFMDCDILCMGSVARLFEQAKSDYAVMCVKHHHEPSLGYKMDGQLQVRYQRKNWSSVMLFNCDHVANKALTIEMLNTVPGRDLHRFCWLDDQEIGELSPRWNYLVGHTTLDEDPVLVHYTDGLPSMPGYENCEYSREFFEEQELWAA